MSKRDNLIKSCLDTNKALLELFAKDLQVSLEILEERLHLVGKHEILLDMAGKVREVYKQNPKALVNFGDYGEKVAAELGVQVEKMYEGVLAAAFNDLLMKTAKQINNIYKIPDEAWDGDSKDEE